MLLIILLKYLLSVKTLATPILLIYYFAHLINTLKYLEFRLIIN